jgi:spore coat protein U-like protein
VIFRGPEKNERKSKVIIILKRVLLNTIRGRTGRDAPGIVLAFKGGGKAYGSGNKKKYTKEGGNTMKKILFLMLAMLLALAGTSMAATVSDTVPVTAVILGSCLIDTATASIDFGSLDPNVAPLVSATVVPPQVTCTAGVNYVVSTDDGLQPSGPGAPNMDDGLGNQIPYTVSYDTNYVGTGAPLNVTTLQGTIPALSYQFYPTGNYNDTLTFIVTW